MISFRLVLVFILILLASCAEPRSEVERYYHNVSNNLPGTGAVTELQRDAIRALSRGSNQQAIDFLQRAIKIEPRNPFSWHYLAQAYWFSRNYDRCIDMLERSISYSSASDDLDRANSALQIQCMDN